MLLDKGIAVGEGGRVSRQHQSAKGFGLGCSLVVQVVFYPGHLVGHELGIVHEDDGLGRRAGLGRWVLWDHCDLLVTEAATHKM
jgi:hypothetical protein